MGSWFQPRAERFLAERRFWVERASPPEDYLYENLSVCRASKVGRKVGGARWPWAGLSMCRASKVGHKEVVVGLLLQGRGLA